MKNAMEVKLKWIILVLNTLNVCAKDTDELLIDDDYKHLNAFNEEEEEVTENVALLKINFFAILFINIYIVAFVVLIVYCTRCGENRKGKDLMVRNSWESDFEANLIEACDPLIQRCMPLRLAVESYEPFDNQ